MGEGHAPKFSSLRCLYTLKTRTCGQIYSIHIVINLSRYYGQINGGHARFCHDQCFFQCKLIYYPKVINTAQLCCKNMLTFHANPLGFEVEPRVRKKILNFNIRTYFLQTYVHVHVYGNPRGIDPVLRRV